jgi:predicted N-acyltransferase
VQKLRLLEGISSIEPSEWDACAGPDDPFTSYAYLQALEESGCVSEKNGFRVQHLVIEDAWGKALAVAPTYLKWHSEAEIGADMAWAMAYERFRGRSYYPKLQVEVPYSPATGARLLVRPDQSKDNLVKRLLETLLAQAELIDAQSVHINFLTSEEKDLVSIPGTSIGAGYQFLWQNREFQDFDQFLSLLKKNKRSVIRRERKDALASNLSIARFSGKEITPEHIDKFVPLYENTYRKYRTKIFMNDRFFQLLREKMPERMLLVFVRRGNDLVAGTLSLIGGSKLYIMHWGSKVQSKFLHFEITYYQAIEFAIEHRLQYIDGGPGGFHKVARGFLPFPAYHCHWFRDADFGRLVMAGLQRRLKIIGAEQERLRSSSPYKVDRMPRPALV